MFPLNINIERTMATLAIVSFALTSINTLIVKGNMLTRKEAIEISRNSELMRSLLEDAERYTLEVHYSKQTENHNIWFVMWYIHPEGAVSAFAYCISHIIDGETGEILYEGSASAR